MLNQIQIQIPTDCGQQGHMPCVSDYGRSHGTHVYSANALQIFSEMKYMHGCLLCEMHWGQTNSTSVCSLLVEILPHECCFTALYTLAKACGSIWQPRVLNEKEPLAVRLCTHVPKMHHMRLTRRNLHAIDTAHQELLLEAGQVLSRDL